MSTGDPQQRIDNEYPDLGESEEYRAFIARVDGGWDERMPDVVRSELRAIAA